MFRIRFVTPLFIMIAACLVIAPTCAQCPALTLGVPVSDSLTAIGDSRCYEVTVSSNASLMVMVRGDSPYYYYQVTVHQGSLAGPEVGQRWQQDYDTSVEVSAPTPGDYYVEVRNVHSGSRSFTLLADQRPVVTISLGVEQPNQPLWGMGDVAYYKVTVNSSASLMVMVRGNSPYYYYQVTVHQGSLAGREVGQRWQQDYDTSVEVSAPTPGDYYVEVRNVHSGGRSFTLLADQRPVAPLTWALPQPDQPLWGMGDVRYYKVTVSSSASLMTMVRGNSPYYYYQVTLHQGSLAGPEVGQRWQQEYDTSVEVGAPTPGDYYAEVRSVHSGSRSFTLVADQRPVLALPLGVEQPNQPLWGMGDVRYYKLTASSSATLMVMVRGDSPYYYYQVTVHQGSLAGPEVGQRWQQDHDTSVEVSAPTPGDYYAEVRDVHSGTRAYSIIATGGGTTVTSVAPEEVGYAGSVTVTIRGSGFQSGATAKTCRHDDPGICVDATDVTVINPTELTARFDFKGAPIGSVWDVFVTNPDTNQAGLLSALRLAQPQVNLWVDIVGPDRVRQTTKQTFIIRYGNAGNVDAYDVLIKLRLRGPEGTTWTLDIPPLHVPGVEGPASANYVTSEGIETPIWVSGIPAGTTRTHVATVTVGTLGGASGDLTIDGEMVRFPATPFALTGDLNSLDSSPIFQSLRDAWFTTASAASAEFAQYVDRETFEAFMRSFVTQAFSGSLASPQAAPSEPAKMALAAPAPPAVDPGAFSLADTCMVFGSACATLIQSGVCTAGPYGAGLCAGICGTAAIACSQIGYEMYKFFKWLIWDKFDPWINRWGGKTSNVVRAIDPNEKEGSSGFGAQGHVGDCDPAHCCPCPPVCTVDEGWVSNNRPLEYVIRFENLATATAEAENIVVTDTLDPSLDWSTLEIGETRIGGATYFPTVTMNPATRTICWTFTGVNLPPNCDDPARPECKGIGKGEGSVSFSVKPLAQLQTGTEIHNHATIVFDTNPPMCTNDVVHTIDSVAPTSQVNVLPAQSESPFLVCWAGADDPDGTGVRDHTIYVSDNGGPFTAWLSNTIEPSALFEGTPGHEYCFFSVARDNVGNMEAPPAPGSPDACTTVTGRVGININNDAACTRSPSVTLNVSRDGDIPEVRFRNEPGDWGPWEPYAESEAWTLTAGDGVKSVCVQGRDASQNESAPACDSIVFDTTFSGDMTAAINGGAECTTSANVTLSLGAADAAEMRFRNETVAWSAWEPYANTKTWTLSEGRGLKTVGFQCRDACGNESAEVARKIILATFDDVGCNEWFLTYVEALFRAGITSGCSGTPPQYCPYRSVTRAEMAKFLCVAAGKTELFPPTPTFTDVQPGPWYYGWVERLADPDSWCGDPPTSGIGCPPGVPPGSRCYGPFQPVTREQMAKFICLAACKTPVPACTGVFADVRPGYFCPFIERLADPISWPGGVPVVTGCTCPPGYPGGARCYCPKANATRAEMAKFLVLAFGLPL